MLRKLACLPLLFLAACGQGDDQPAEDGSVKVTIRAVVPAETGELYLTGNLDSLGPWDANGLLMSGADMARYAVVDMPDGHPFEYKFTKGEWAQEAADADGIPYPNFTLTAADGIVAEHTIEGFKADPDTLLDDIAGAGIEGELIYWKDWQSEILQPTRHVSIWLPPSYGEDEDRRYPVIYMTDGQNLFDPRIANTGTDWGMDEAMMRGVRSGAFEPAIIVATWSTVDRGPEYSPWANGPSYARLLKEELKPRIDEEFRTLPDRENTFVMGSSMGGLMSMYLVREHADTFSACGCVSTHLPLSERWIAAYTGGNVDEADPTPYYERDMANGSFVIPEGTRMFFDYGTETLDAQYPPHHEALRAYFEEQGYTEGEDFLIREYPGAAHNEAAWRARAEDQLVWMLGRSVPE